jgi:hypothetical protein
MAINLANYVQSVWYRLSQGKAEQDIGIYRAAIEQSLDSALERLAQNVADSPNVASRSDLQKSFSLTVSSGEVAVDSTMVTSALPSAYITLSGVTEPCAYVPNLQDAKNPLPFPDFYTFTVHEDKLKFFDYTGTAATQVAGTAYTSFVPTIGQVPDELSNELYDIGAALVMETNVPMQQIAQAGMPPKAA